MGAHGWVSGGSTIKRSFGALAVALATNTAYFRVTPNAGGCGNGKCAKDYTRWDTGWGSTDIKMVCARLTKDVPMGNDKPYKGTTDCVQT